MARQPYVIRDVKAIRLLASPLRQAMLDWIVARGPATVAELSAPLRRPADRLYYHVRLLERAGLLIASDEGGGAGGGGGGGADRKEARFDVPGRPLILEYQPSAATNRRAVTRVISAVLRSARRDFTRALGDETLRVSGPKRELWSGRTESMLSASEVETLNRLLVQIQDLLHRTRTSTAAGRKPFQFTWAFSPTTRRAGKD